jgi:hypothetical protein
VRISAALEQAIEIDSSRKDAARSGHNQGSHRLVFQLGELSGEVFEKLQVHGIGLTMLDSEDGNRAPVFSCNHDSLPRAYATPAPDGVNSHITSSIPSSGLEGGWSL